MSPFFVSVVTNASDAESSYLELSISRILAGLFSSPYKSIGI